LQRSFDAELVSVSRNVEAQWPDSMGAVNVFHAVPALRASSERDARRNDFDTDIMMQDPYPLMKIMIEQSRLPKFERDTSYFIDADMRNQRDRHIYIYIYM